MKLFNSIFRSTVRLVLIFHLWIGSDVEGSPSYSTARENIIKAEGTLSTGGSTVLSSKEQKVDDLFLHHKKEELLRGFHDSDLNVAAMHFFKGKPLIDKSGVFQFLRKMPKGALLHVHNSASVSSEWTVRNISYMPGLVRCVNADDTNILSFRRSEDHGCKTSYVSISDERAHSISRQEYDRNFERLFDLYTSQPEVDYPTIDIVWTRFQNMFTTIKDLLRYLPAFRAYHWQMMEEMYEDNIMYAEVRMDFKELYDIDGRTFPRERSVQELISISEKFSKQHPNFVGIKVIYSTHRKVRQDAVQTQLERFKLLHDMYPNFIIGFDLVGQEDKGKPLRDFVETLATFSLPKSAHYFFHAGETNYYGGSADYNLLDALMLNTTRIGHGYALSKHPLLLKAVKERHVAVEVCPISNQVLHLVADLRNHPGGYFMSDNVPMVICNDDPGFWNAKGLSYDFYYAIMSMAPINMGLRTLKNLVFGSIRYSVLAGSERVSALAGLERAWNHFIDDVLQGLVF